MKTEIKSDNFNLSQNINGLSSYPRIFARHETFHPRFGWLKKGYDSVIKNPSIFNDDRALIILGVGKNMVRSIKYWCETFKIIEFQKQSNNSTIAITTDFGSKLLSDNGWDPYLENPASLWLLHWNLLKQPCRATTWFYIINKFAGNDFTVEDVFIKFKNYLEYNFISDKIADSSLKKDINCFVRMYSDSNKNIKGPQEDSINSPFSYLGLVRRMGDSSHFQISIGHKHGLANEIILYSCLDYISGIGHTAQNISISRLTNYPGSPGFIYKVPENVIESALETLASKNPDISIQNSSGIIQFSFKKDPSQIADQILNKYYKASK